jgi:membrane-bound lytic murein transglycosylase B
LPHHDWTTAMIRARRTASHRPKHARPSVLAPSRTVVALSGAGVLAVAIVAGCAAVTGDARPAAHAADRPAAVRAGLGPAAGYARVRTASGAGLGAIDLAALQSGGAVAADPASTATDAAVPPPDLAPVSSLASSGIPSTALAAYQQAAAREAARKPDCGLPWPLLAGIGRVESNHGRFAGAVLHADGVSTPRIVGIPLDGHGTALIRDTDGGRLDGDRVYDRAVGPMQFIPSTWAGWGVDADSDGVRDPNNIFDAAAAAADYLCAAGRNLTTSQGQVKAILSYNYSYDYVSLVMGLERVYAQGLGVTVPVLPTAPTQHGRPRTKPPLPPVDPGTPVGANSGDPTKSPSKSPSSSSAHATPTTPAASDSSSSTPAGSPSDTGDPSSPSDSPTTPTDPTPPPVTDPGGSSSSSSESGSGATASGTGPSSDTPPS